MLLTALQISVMEYAVEMAPEGVTAEGFAMWSGMPESAVREAIQSLILNQYLEVSDTGDTTVCGENT